MDSPYDDGFDAGLDLDFSPNPYTEGTLEYAEWNRGFSDGVDEYEAINSEDEE